MDPALPHADVLQALVQARADLAFQRKALNHSYSRDDPVATEELRRQVDSASERCMTIGSQLWNLLRAERGQS